ncbi:DUF1285 domain-containing protein [Ancylobacter oerskovii]|uniref:DUF1285 domain-containing protein n=1 Tax=Ancylobacter oerskovii TaxID=459519 RepID=A0ABW4Z4D1_9HYPH|nr:DUF1285 domain-containing protein [Ancylobacter oerskovii]
MRSIAAAKGAGGPPLERWDPPDCGDIDIRIDREGGWHHEGRPIGRPALVRLFASVMRREGERHVLVTPVEKLGITVEDAPFLAVEMRAEEAMPDGPARGEPGLAFRTNLDDWVICDAAHPLRFDAQADGAVRPYIYVRRGLWARLTRPVFLELVERGEVREAEGRRLFGVASSGAFFPIAAAEETEERE